MIKKENLLERIKNSIEKSILKLTGDYQWINKKYAGIFFNEVKQDLKFLRRGMEECKFERDRDELFQYYIKKYQESYCSSNFYKYFSNENKLKYLDLRIELDEILSRKKEIFSDFIAFNKIETKEINYN